MMKYVGFQLGSAADVEDVGSSSSAWRVSTWSIAVTDCATASTLSRT